MNILYVFNIRTYSAVFLCRYSMHIMHALYAHILLCYMLMSFTTKITPKDQHFFERDQTPVLKTFKPEYGPVIN